MFTRMRNDIRAIIERDPAAHSWLEVMLCYPGLHALWLHRIANVFWRIRLRLIARLIALLSRFFTGIEIHPAATIGKRFVIDHGMGVVIGETTIIGDDVTLYHGVTLGGTSFHAQGVRHPRLENHVVVGAGATLLGPITIGEHARIGSNAVVLKDVEAGQTMVGVPAREARSKRTLKTEQKRNAEHEHEEFAPYGTDRGSIQDPTQHAINTLSREIKNLKAEVKALKEEFKK